MSVTVDLHKRLFLFYLLPFVERNRKFFFLDDADETCDDAEVDNDSVPDLGND